jgi:hypothetical protein
VEVEPQVGPKIPGELAEIIEQLDAAEMRALVRSGRSLLELREAKAEYEAEPPREAEGTPGP